MRRIVLPALAIGSGPLSVGEFAEALAGALESLVKCSNSRVAALLWRRGGAERVRRISRARPNARAKPNFELA